MKGYFAGIVCGLLAMQMWSSHPPISIIAALPLPVVVLAFWTGVIGVRFDKA